MDPGQNIRETIWQVIAQIPEGKVASYGQIAKLAGLPGYARQVGNTLKNLPKDTRLPWHRVINAKGEISFAEDSQAYRTQRSRLESEGIVFNRGKIELKQYRWDIEV
jgi:methylated-DNA-protein-cysteine methyltransferase related protein